MLRTLIFTPFRSRSLVRPGRRCKIPTKCQLRPWTKTRSLDSSATEEKTPNYINHEAAAFRRAANGGMSWLEMSLLWTSFRLKHRVRKFIFPKGWLIFLFHFPHPSTFSFLIFFPLAKLWIACNVQILTIHIFNKRNLNNC